ncbi:MAG: bifunctional MaoC family dehydratase N-terminal/OB-fold nucleic acid binding domain-containing protein [Myxococcota bacterium]
MPLTPEQKKELEARLREFVGRPIGPSYVGRDEVNEPMIRQWCDAMGDTNPAYLDPAAASQSVHGGVVAPPTMLQAWTMHGFEMAKGYDEPTNEEQRLHKVLTDAGYTGVVGTNTAQGYTRYLRPGDRVSADTVIESISEEKATALGIGYFIVTRTSFKDQDGEEVGWMTFRVLKYIPAQQPAAPAEESGAPAVPGRIRPPRGHDNGWWWDLVDQGRFPIQSCNRCGELHHPPRPMCHKCRSMEMGWIEASGRGTLHSYTVIHHPQFPGYDFPIVAALVDLEEGTRIVSNVVDCKPEDVEIGMALEGFIHEDDDGFKLPLFRPAKAKG